MAFKITGGDTVALDDPEAMFRDFRSRTIPGPLGHQSEMIRAYVTKALDVSDVAFQLPTGSGKTLVALLVAEWRRRRDGLTVAYLCPTNQLVNQVVDQATRKYGMDAIAFTGSKHDYDPADKTRYATAQAIAVTTYSALFNTRSFFESPGLLVLDDAHAAENYVAQHWSLSIRASEGGHRVLFDALSASLRAHLSATDYARLRGESGAGEIDATWVEKLPTPTFFNLSGELSAILDEHASSSSDDDLKYRWKVLRGALPACHAYLSAGTLLIRPLIPPTRTHQPFWNARQRLYMSATLGAGGELERLTGVPRIYRLPVPQGWDKQGIGRRFFLFPQCSLEQTDAGKLMLDAMSLTPRSLVITTRDKQADQVAAAVTAKHGYPIFRAAQLEESKEDFVNATQGVAVIANRYDGIDLVDDECRMLIVAGLPRTLNLHERFLVHRIGASSVFTDRVLTRVVQAVGRCTRSATDYAAVLILGEDLSRFLLNADNRKLLHPELQGELAFGITQSSDVSLNDFTENLRDFLAQSPEWRKADTQIIRHRMAASVHAIPGIEDLQNAVEFEVKYQYAVWQEDYEVALDAARAVLSRLNAPELRGYRAYWSYLAGSAAWLAHQRGVRGMDRIARDFFAESAKANSSIRWLAVLRRVGLTADGAVGYDDRLMSVIERLEAKLDGFGVTRDNRFEKDVRSILEGLAKDDSRSFEEAHRRLGELLGYEAGNSEGDADPDPWWIANDDWCLVFEDHSDANDGGQLGAVKVRQATSHPNWIRANVPTLSAHASILSVLVTPKNSIAHGAVPHAGTTGYWPLSDFRAFASDAIATVRELRRSFNGVGDLAWRANASGVYVQHGLDPASLESRVKCNPLARLPVVG